MNNFEFLKKYQVLQQRIIFEDLIDLGFAIIGYSKTDKSSYWNFALVNKQLSEGQIREVEKAFKLIGRIPAFYFERKSILDEFVKRLIKNEYRFSFEDSWQFWDKSSIDSRHFESVKKVTSSEELELFLQTFDKCYQKDDPQNPYGELGGYLKVTEKAWKKHSKTDRLEYFIVYKDAKPVAVSTLTNFEKIGYISNVGSLKEVRGEGYGKAATLYCIYQSKKHGNTMHCLATEEGSYPNTFYKKIGFATKFTAVGYKKGIS